jgi:mannonate dehydratase
MKDISGGRALQSLKRLGRREFLAFAAAPLAGAPLLRGMPTPTIKDVSVITTEPAGVRLVVVKVLTDQDGLYGYGCATFTQRADLVVEAVNRYLRPCITRRTGAMARF